MKRLLAFTIFFALLCTRILAQHVPATYQEATLHRIKSSETLYSISRQYGLSLKDLSAWNQIEDVTKIEVGQTLILSPNYTGTAPRLLSREESQHYAGQILWLRVQLNNNFILNRSGKLAGLMAPNYNESDCWRRQVDRFANTQAELSKYLLLLDGLNTLIAKTSLTEADQAQVRQKFDDIKRYESQVLDDLNKDGYPVSCGSRQPALARLESTYGAAQPYYQASLPETSYPPNLSPAMPQGNYSTPAYSPKPFTPQYATVFKETNIVAHSNRQGIVASSRESLTQVQEQKDMLIYAVNANRKYSFNSPVCFDMTKTVNLCDINKLKQNDRRGENLKVILAPTVTSPPDLEGGNYYFFVSQARGRVERIIYRDIKAIKSNAPILITLPSDVGN